MVPVCRCRLIQSMAFFRSGGSEWLYSGVAMKTPWFAAISLASLVAFSGMPLSSSMSPLKIGRG